ncbi:glycerate kinase [Clostridia bacterium]|nr:glycerate kinase [Clostridia bacterium]
MSSSEVCGIVKKAFTGIFPELQTVCIPVADGGEGTADAFLYALGGRRVGVRAADPAGREIDSFYGLLPDGKTAVIETAAASGLPLTEGRNDPLAATTLGTGRLIAHALDAGCDRILLGIGGSATTDAGAGALTALGFRFLDKNGRAVGPGGGGLSALASIDASGKHKRLRSCEITVACDVDNPLYGPRGAARVFAPQKGADADAVDILDANLRHFAEVVKKQTGVDLQRLKGAGAAGGLGAGLYAFAGARLSPGIDIVLDMNRFDTAIADCDLVITGEGKFDSQSLAGKVPIGIAKRAAAIRKPVVVLAGDVGAGIEAAYGMGITAVFSTNRRAVPFEQARLTCREDMFAAAEALARVIRGREK